VPSTSLRALAFLSPLLAACATQAPPPRPIEIGVCTGIGNLEAAKAAGFDYVELPATQVAGLSDADFAALRERLRALGIPVPVTNNFLPGDLKLTGDRTDAAKQEAYVTKTFDRLQQLGVRVVVFGSGTARRVPDGFPRDAAWQQLADFGRRIAPLARARGLVVVVEPLRRQETNVVNTVAEGVELVRAVGDPDFGVMVDFYHLSVEREDPAILVRDGPRVQHVHIANPQGRVFPLDAAEADYAAFFARLREIGYAGRISVEAGTEDFAADAPRAIALLRAAFP
jgi:sugar phosphate isomerase/epimerase